MAESINNRKLQQTSYLREVQQEKSARKRDLASQQQQDLLDLRQYYVDENKKLEQQSADTVNHIRGETKEMIQQYSDEKRQQQEDVKALQTQQRQARMDAAAGDSVNSASVDEKTTYNRQGLKRSSLQNHEANKDSDDFYKVQNRGSRVAEKSNHYIIEAYAPEHEKDNIRVSVHRDKAVVSGKRKFGDSVEDGNKKMSTNNFQTFREEFKFNRPVSNEGMTRERFGDYVRFTIPKLESVDTPDENS